MTRYLIKQYQNESFSISTTKRILGYQGFSVSCSTGKQIFINGLIQLEKELLKSGLKYLSSDVIDYVNQYMGESIPPTISDRITSINCDRVPIK